VPVVNPPPETTASPPPQPQPQSPIVSRTPDPALAVSDAIQAYARALGAGDLALARQIYPGMPTEQREGLEVVWRQGGTLAPSWTVSDIVVDATTATARVRGTTVITMRNGQRQTQPVALRARLERRGTQWRLVALVN
jgi:hypothetical protein